VLILQKFFSKNQEKLEAGREAFLHSLAESEKAAL
jgi:hypothetical protein